MRLFISLLFLVSEVQKRSIRLIIKGIKIVVLPAWMAVFWNVSVTGTSRGIRRLINLRMKRRLSGADGAKGIPWLQKKE